MREWRSNGPDFLNALPIECDTAQGVRNDPVNRLLCGEEHTVTIFSFFGAGAEAQILGNRHPMKICPQAEKPKISGVYQKPRETGLRASGPEIQTLAVDTRTAVCLSTAEKIVVGETQNFLESFGWSERQLCIRTRPLQPASDLSKPKSQGPNASVWPRSQSPLHFQG